jgi:hypothetical protein
MSWRTWIVVAVTFPSASPSSALLRMDDWDDRDGTKGEWPQTHTLAMLFVLGIRTNA